MKCHDSESYFMKFMDSTLDEKSAQELNSHIRTCESCKEEFLVYNMMMDEFSLLELVVAPEGFEARVIEKINLITGVNYENEHKVDNIICIVWSTISAFIGIGFMIGFYNTQIINFLSSYPSIYGFVEMFKPVSEFTKNIIFSLLENANNLVDYSVSFISSIRLYIMIATISVVVAKFFLIRKAADK